MTYSLLFTHTLISFPGVGPGAGAIVAVGFYQFIKILEYEMANPGQDETSEEAAAEAATTKKESV